MVTSSVTTPAGARLFLQELPGTGEHLIRNRADEFPEYDRHEDAPIIDETRAATVAVILNHARTKPDPIVKVSRDLIPRPTVKGYATFLSQIKGKTLAQLESSLGFAQGRLSLGAMVYFVDAFALDSSNIAPRGNTNWSAGVTPEELHKMRESNPHLTIRDAHPDYPRAETPIYQMVIYRHVSHDGRPRRIDPGTTV